MKPLTPLQKRVLQVINDNPQAANDDPMLEDIYYHKYDGWDDSMSYYWNKSRVTSSESLSRARRKLYELGLINYSNEADAAREKKFIEYRYENGEEIAVI